MRTSFCSRRRSAQLLPLMRAMAPHLGAQTIVTDAGSTKQDVVRAARSALAAALPRFVPGHPIAGTERSGAAAAQAALYAGRNVVLTPLPETDPLAAATVAAAWTACGARSPRARPGGARSHLRRGVAPAARPRVRARQRVRHARRRRGAVSVRRQRLPRLHAHCRRARPKCGATLRSRTASRSSSEIGTYRAELDRLAALIGACDGEALEACIRHGARRSPRLGRARRRIPSIGAGRRQPGRRVTSPPPLAGAAAGFLDLEPVASARGTVALPGSKSISNRTLLLAALASGDTRVGGLLAADDVERMREALAALGFRIERDESGADVVHGRGGGVPAKAATLFLGNAGHRVPAAHGRARAGGRRLHASRAPRGCTSGRSGISSTRCGRWARTSTIWRPPVIRRSRSDRIARPRPPTRAREPARRRVEPVPFGAADGVAAPDGADSTRGDRRHRRRPHLEAVRDDDAQSHAPLRRRGGARRIPIVCRASRCALCESRHDPGRRRRVIGLVFSRRRSDRRRPGAGHGRRP